MDIKKVFNKNDEYYTPKYAIRPLMPFLKPFKKIWCPFDMEWSNYVKMLSEEHEVIYTHKDTGGDFFEIDVPECDAIISNPPYSSKTKVLEKLFEIDKPFAMLVGCLGVFESKRRYEMFSKNKFEVLNFDKRVSFIGADRQVKVNTPFSSIYICHNILPQQIMFREIDKTDV